MQGAREFTILFKYILCPTLQLKEQRYSIHVDSVPQLCKSVAFKLAFVLTWNSESSSTAHHIFSYHLDS